MKTKSSIPRLNRVAILTILTAIACATFPVFADDDDDKGGEENEAVGEGGVIPADDIDLLMNHLMKPVIVRGTIDKVKTFKTSGNVLINFKDSELAIFIRKSDLDKDLSWDLKKWMDEEVFVAGQLKKYRDQLEVVIVAPDQIADSPDGFDLATIPLPEDEKKKPASTAKPKKPKPIKGAITPTNKDYPDLPLKLEETSVQTLAYHIYGTGLFARADPYGLPKDGLTVAVATVTATVKKAEGSGAMQVVFPKPEKDSAGEIKAMLDQLAENYGKWPRDKVLTIDVDFESREFMDDPSTLTIATLIHSLATGKQPPSNVIVSADVASDGSLVETRGNVEGAVIARTMVEKISEEVASPARLVCADMAVEELSDFVIDENWEALSSVTVLGCATLKDAIRLIFAGGDGALGQALAGFDQAQAVIKKEGSSKVRSKEVQQQVMAAGKAWPTNKTALLYVNYARNKIPRSYSLPYSHKLIRDLHNQIRFYHLADLAEPKEKFREEEAKIKALRDHLPPDLSKLQRTLASFAGEVADSEIKPKKGRSKEKQAEKITKMDKAITLGLDNLARQIKGEEPQPEEEE